MIALYPRRGHEAKKAILRGSMSLIKSIGHIIEAEQRANRNPVDALASELDGVRLRGAGDGLGKRGETAQFVIGGILDPDIRIIDGIRFPNAIYGRIISIIHRMIWSGYVYLVGHAIETIVSPLNLIQACVLLPNQVAVFVVTILPKAHIRILLGDFATQGIIG